MTVKSILLTMHSDEIAEYMAFDLLKDADTLERLRSDMMSDAERMESIKKLLRGTDNGNDR